MLMKVLNQVVRFVLWAAVPLIPLAVPAFSQTEATTPQAAAARPVGSVKAVGDNSITLTTDAGAEVTIAVQPATRIVRIPVGQKDLKSATPIQLNEIQVGDRALVSGTAAATGNLVNAARIVLMKQSDIAQKQQQDREDWQKRGVGGLVTAVDLATTTVTISAGPGKTMAVHTSKTTIIRRYSPDSVKFDDAKPATLDQIKQGDQLRARGERSTDGTELAAEEIVSGTFRNIAGTVISADAANQSVTVQDLLSKKPVTIKVSSDSQLRQLPAMLAQRMAARLKGVNAGPQNPSTGERGSSTPAAPGGPGAGGPQGDRPRSGQPDLQQILSRMPAVAVGDLKKDDAVMVVATEGSASSAPTAITLLTGVEPILTASPKDGRAATMLLSPWSLGGPAGDAGSQ